MGLPLSEPEERTRTDEQIRWHLRLRLHKRTAPLHAYQQLEGYSWSCPDCNRTKAVVLIRRGSRYWFVCRRLSCRWQGTVTAEEGRALFAELQL